MILSDILVARVMHEYGYDDCLLSHSESGYRNTSHTVIHKDKTYNLIVYKSEPGVVDTINRINEVGKHLQRYKLPVRAPVDRRILRLGDTKSYVALYNYLPGVTIPWEAYTMKHIKLLGSALGHLHRGLSDLSGDGYPNVSDQYRVYLTQMRNYFNNTLIGQAIYEKLDVKLSSGVFDELTTFIDAANLTPNQQLLHMDLVRGNVLFGGISFDKRFTIGDVSITGIIDFEKISFGNVIFDLARTMAFLFVDCKYKTEDKVRKYFLESGYIKRGMGTYLPLQLPDGRDGLETGISLFLLYDFYKFLLHNPYESLKENHHYLATRDILKARKVLQ